MYRAIKIKYIGYCILKIINKSEKIISFIYFLIGAIIFFEYYTKGGLILSAFGIICFFMYKKLNKFTDINIYTGCLHMRSDVKKEDLKSSKNDIAILNSLVDEFVKAICLVPEKTKHCPFRILKKEIYAKTNEVIIKKAEKMFKNKNTTNILDVDELGYKAVKEKMFKYNLKDISNFDKKNRYDKLKKKSKSVKVSIKIVDIEKNREIINPSI